MYTDRYFSKNANNKVIEWSAGVTFDGTVEIMTGLFGNTRRIINNNVVPKANRTKEQQAILEVKAKVKKKVSNGYRTINDLGISSNLDDVALLNRLEKVLTINKKDANDVRKPMKAQQFKPNKVKYPVICQPKLNGYRSVAMLVNKFGSDLFADNIGNVKLLTKEGHEYVMPDIANSFSSLLKMDNSIIFDGELYVHNEKISQLKRRVRMRKIDSNTISKNSMSDKPVKFAVFDLSIPEVPQLLRLQIKDELLVQCQEIYYNTKTDSYEFSDISNVKYPNIINVRGIIIHSDEEAYKYKNAAIKSGFEGIILRELDAEYMFGGRRKNMVKLKDTMSSEFEILDVILKNEDNVRTYIGFKLRNDINDSTFEVTALGDEEDRQNYITHPEKLIGKKLSLTFGERTITGKPFHIKNMNVREVWDMDVNDLNIEI